MLSFRGFITRYAALMLGYSGALLCAQDVPALRARLHAVAVASSLDAPDLMPWHLRMAVQLFDEKGALLEEGTIEEWWSRPDAYRIAYTFPSYTGVQARTPKDFFHSAGPGAPPAMAEYVLRQTVHPLPDGAELDEITPDNRKETFGGTAYDCVMLDRPMKNVAYPPLGLFPTYCLDHTRDVLAASFEYGNQLTTRGKVGSFQQKTVPLSLKVTIGQLSAAAGQVTTLQGRSSPYPEAEDMSGLVVSKPAAGVPGGVVAGMLIKHVSPRYPQAAKDRHATGAVVLHAIIGRDGHIQALTPIQVPDPDLAIAAIGAVRQWVYKPYLLNGEPTEVDTKITVNFELGP